jgi:hypothetical protein
MKFQYVTDLMRVSKGREKMATFSPFFSKWLMDHLPERAFLKPQLAKTGERTMSVDNFYTSFMFYGVGTTFAMACFFLENARGRRSGQRNLVKKAEG